MTILPMLIQDKANCIFSSIILRIT